MEPWKTSELEPFQDQFLAGLKTERYAVDLKEGLIVAKRLMEPTIMQLIREDIGGDHQQIHSTDTRYLGITFKHCLLPVWVANYRYNEKLFQILINGRTGRVSGERPYSWWKIGALVLVILTVIALILTMVMTAKGSKDGAPVRAPVKRSARSRREPPPRPRAIRVPGKLDAIVETTGTSLPKLEAHRRHAIPAPVGRPRHVAVRVPRHEGGVLRLQETPIGDLLALSRRPGAKPRTERASGEVLVRFVLGHSFDATLDADLPLDRVPRKNERDLGVRGHLPALAAIVIGEEGEAARIVSLEKNETDRGESVGCRGCQREGVGFMYACRDCLFEPQVKERERVHARLRL